MNINKIRNLTIFSSVALIACLFSIFKGQKLLSTQPDLNHKTKFIDGQVIAYTPPENADDETIVFPNNAGVINVKNAPYSAKGDGVTDDTNAIQKALSAYPNGNRIIYLPNGTYLISQPLKWPDGVHGNSYKRTILQGQNTTRTIIKLKDRASGFTDSTIPQAVIWTGNAPAQRFRNAIRNLTVDTGSGNKGAVGIQFIANNQGAIRNVTIRSGDGQGLIGLDMGFTDEVGPLLVKHLKVSGFNLGIKTANTVNSQTFEHIILENQKEYGLHNNGQVISIRGLQSKNAVPAINNLMGVMTLLDATLTGTGNASSQPAINNQGAIFARDITTSGYQIAIQNTNGTRKNATGSTVSEFVSHPIHSLFSTPLQSLNLPIQETPEIPWDALSNWVSPTRYGAVPNDNKDDSAAIQA
ncbi:MAG TPA: glycoside hydrolase family 55 protein, partial [Coleofasciculaceae cyanobacterium]